MADYTTTTALLAAMDKQVDDASGRMVKLITSVSRAIDGICNRPDGFVAPDVATARVFAGRNRGVLRIDECVAITSVAVKRTATDTTYTAWESDDWIAFSGDETFPNFNRTPYTGIMAAPGSGQWFTGTLGGDEIAWESGRAGSGMSRFRRRGAAPPTCQVTARWGYASTVPPVIEEACIMQCARLWKRVQGAMSDTLTGGEMGQLIYRVKLDPDVELLLKGARMVRPALG